MQEIASSKAEFAPDSLSAQKGTFGLALIGPRQTNSENDPQLGFYIPISRKYAKDVCDATYCSG